MTYVTEKQLSFMRINLLVGAFIFAFPAIAQETQSQTGGAPVFAAQGDQNRAVAMIPPAPMGPYYSQRLMPQRGHLGFPNGPATQGGFPPVGFDPVARTAERSDVAGKDQAAAPDAPATMRGYPGPGYGTGDNGAGQANMQARMNSGFDMTGRNGWGGNNAFANGSPYGQPYGMPYGTPFNRYPQAPNMPQMVPGENAVQNPAQMRNRIATAPDMQPPAEPEWVTRRRADAEKYRAEAQKRYAAAMRYRVEMQQRFAEESRRRAAAYGAQGYAAQGYGTPVRPNYRPGYGVPYRAPYGYAQQQQNGLTN